MAIISVTTGYPVEEGVRTGGQQPGEMSEGADGNGDRRRSSISDQRVKVTSSSPLGFWSLSPAQNTTPKSQSRQATECVPPLLMHTNIFVIRAPPHDLTPNSTSIIAHPRGCAK